LVGLTISFSVWMKGKNRKTGWFLTIGFCSLRFSKLNFVYSFLGQNSLRFNFISVNRLWTTFISTYSIHYHTVDFLPQKFMHGLANQGKRNTDPKGFPLLLGMDSVQNGVPICLIFLLHMNMRKGKRIGTKSGLKRGFFEGRMVDDPKRKMHSPFPPFPIFHLWICDFYFSYSSNLLGPIKVCQCHYHYPLTKAKRICVQF
jgi:hypothetical protein